MDFRIVIDEFTRLSMAASPLIPLIGCSYTLSAYLIALIIILSLVCRNWKTLALPLRICMVDWIISSLSVVPFMSYIIFWWDGADSLYDMTVMFWVGVPYFSIVSPVSIGVFSLTLDRIFSLLLPIHYKKEYRYLLHAINLIVQLSLFLVIFLLERTDTAPPNTLKHCMAVGCMTAHSGVYISQFKLAVGILNTTGAIVFAVIFARFSRRRVVPTKESNRRSQRQANFLAAIAVVMEFCFNCLPNIVGLAFQTIYGVLPSGDIGPYLSYFLGTETLCISCLYLRVLGNPYKKPRKSTLVTIAKASISRPMPATSSTI
ncbi:unnamed protein product [Bursaphelenchus xylophilus]|uniref:(pine wood nematode) hypothetical protein n=1 Tax=Bursaphelenchus xylophilus TaxID=6326 RepID=A0A1I7RP86_BURXY|nr:unnamed protein product [Bursaphelenchus xylophilus]CAG9095586.1 unnamed protein product [Bursaphelenchus xylophilus]